METIDLYPELVLCVSTDKLALSGEITHFSPEHGIGLENVLDAALALKILPEFIDHEAVMDMLNSGARTVIANGRQVEHGQDTVFTPNFFFEDSLQPNIDTKDIAHYFQTKRYITVEKGEVVMLRAAAIQGIDGIDLFGRTLKAKKAKNIKFKKYPGTTASTNDDTKLIATTSGHPIVQVRGVKIDETLELKNADLGSGNINFDGSVIVKGNVMPLVSIAASGDIYINGTVENATVEAGNNIVIGGGVVSESKPGVKAPPKLQTKLKAGGSIQAKFLIQAEVKAAGKITVQNEVMNSTLVTEQSVQVGEKGGKGTVIGGSILAGGSIVVNELGSTAYVTTEVICGNATEAREKLSSTSSLLHRRLNERKQLKQILQKIKNDPAPTLGEITINRRVKINTAIANLNKVLRKLRNTHGRLKNTVESADACAVVINRKLFPNVHITINEKPYSTQEEKGRTSITCRNGKLEIK